MPSRESPAGPGAASKYVDTLDDDVVDVLPSTFHTECYFNVHKPVSQLTAKGKAYGVSTDKVKYVAPRRAP